MVASAIVGTIVGVWFVLYLIYSFIRKAVVSGTLEALETYDKTHTEQPITMLEIGEEVLKTQKMLELKRKKEAKEAVRMAKKEKKAAKEKVS